VVVVVVVVVVVPTFTGEDLVVYWCHYAFFFQGPPRCGFSFLSFFRLVYLSLGFRLSLVDTLP